VDVLVVVGELAKRLRGLSGLRRMRSRGNSGGSSSSGGFLTKQPSGDLRLRPPLLLTLKRPLADSLGSPPTHLFGVGVEDAIVELLGGHVAPNDGMSSSVGSAETRDSNHRSTVDAHIASARDDGDTAGGVHCVGGLFVRWDARIRFPDLIEKVLDFGLTGY
jgi:hypothetical protein